MNSDELTELNYDPSEDMDLEEVLISSDAVAAIAGMAACEVEGVAGMSSGLTGGIAEALGKVNLSKGVKAVTRNGITTVDIYVIVKYGFRIPDVAYDIQEHVRDSIESQAGVMVDTVNIHVQGVDFGSGTKKAGHTESGV